MRLELQAEGKDVQFLTVNATSGFGFQQELLDKQKFPLFQDQTNVNVWTLLGGYKDDFFIYDKAGNLSAYLPSGGSVDTNLSGAVGYNNLKIYILNALGP